MSIRNQPHIVEFTIESFSKKGNGIGYFDRTDGTRWPIEAPFTMPGDRVRAQLLRKRSGTYQCMGVELLAPSPDRIQPRCKHFGICGGCRWQHIPYEQQLQIKQEMVLKTFKSLMNPQVDVRFILPCHDSWHYRNKMEYSFSSDKDKHHFLGLMMNAGRGKVFNLTECYLSDPWFVIALETVKMWWKESGLDAYHAPKNSGSLRTLTVREGMRTGDRMINLTVSGNPEFALKKQHLTSLVAFLREALEPDDPSKTLSIFLTIHQAKKGNPTQFFEMHLHGRDHIREILRLNETTPLEFKISSSAFFQPNTFQAERLYSTAIEMAGIPENGIVYDLYCGTGTLGICTAKTAKQVIGIELSPEAALDARQNAELNNLTNVTILAGKVHEKLEEIRKGNLFPPPDLIMVDPPRVGLEETGLKEIIQINAPKILYISCNPITQAEDIRALSEAGYQLRALQPVDQFPHTYHIENIAILTKTEK